MIQANELRVGNWIADHEAGGYYQIEEIYKDSYGTYSASYRNSSIRCTIDALEPIPITEKWLVKLGFETQMSWTYRKHIEGNNYLVYYLGEKGWSINNKPYSDFKCKYVHTLQNLYFALTGQELTIKK